MGPEFTLVRLRIDKIMQRGQTIFSDNEIMLQVKAGEVKKLGLLYERHKKALFGFFYKMNRSQSVSEDMVQTVFIKILSSKHTFVGHGKFITWMFHIARNVIHDHYRKNKHTHLQVLEGEGEGEVESLRSAEDVEDKYDSEQTIQNLFKAIDLLDLEKKEIIIMSRFENLKYQEIGAIIGCSEGAVKMKIRRTLIELRDLYNRLESGAADVA